jgi:glycosyltransferase involved in cell wall biosynthesis
MSKGKAAFSASIDDKEVVLDRGGSFSMKLPQERANAFLVLDMYDLDKPVHPEGHIGWWRFQIGQLPERVNGSLSRGENGEIAPHLDGVIASDQWHNPARLDSPRMELLVVMRSSITNAILSIDRVPVLQSDEDLEIFRSRSDRAFRQKRYLSHGDVPLSCKTVHIVSKSIFQRDAVGNLCLALYVMLEQHGISVRLFADDFDFAMNDIVYRRHAMASEVGPEDTILYFFSVHDDALEDIVELKCKRRIAYYHGITPPELLRVFDPELSAQCTKAIRQLPLLARFDQVATNSRATAADLRDALEKSGESLPGEIAVIPPKILGERELRAPEADRAAKAPLRPNFLYVGRIKSHKRIEDFLHLVAQYRTLDPLVRCTIVGAADTPAYADYLNWVQTRQLNLPEEAVTWLGSISEEELAHAYQEATVYITMSEHEGFCLPVLEAMMHNVPVFAYDLPAIREIMGTSGVIFADKSFAELARRLHGSIASTDACSEILATQRERAAELTRKMDGRGFLELLAGP